MECNRDEAVRAKTIAEKKLDDKDFAGAKKFTLKAQTLYPGLDGISQMLITINVYIMSENKVHGESDWYGVLDVTPSDDDETMRKKYRKLALILHPDKNKSVGADGAFKILSEAWSMLSDKDKRLAYNQRRNLRGFQQKVSSQSGRPSADPGLNGFCSSANMATSKPKSQNSTTSAQTHPASVPNQVRDRDRAPAPAPTPATHRTDTFWTICHRCKMNYEYPKVYLNQTLLCPNCHKPFLAAEIAAPIHIPKPAHSSARQRHQNLSNHRSSGNMYNPGRSTAASQAPSGPNSYNNTNAYWSPRTKVPGASAASIAANVVQQVHDRLRRDGEDFYAQRPSKRRKAEDGGQSSNVKNVWMKKN